MIADIQIYEKSFGSKTLYRGLELRIEAGEKIGLIGRNGTGKSTLLNILIGEDLDYDGEVNFRRNCVVVASRQEHHGYEDSTVVDYVLGDLPEYTKLKHILDTYPDKMGEKKSMMYEYNDSLERFMQLNYYEVEEGIVQALAGYQIDEAKARGPLSNLSGGQKRLVELVKVQHATADLALIDEPTNHMDYVAKQQFIQWMRATKDALVVISHDRDVLRSVDRIIEIRDGHADIFAGNYDDYLRVNASRVSNEINEYEVTQSRVKNLRQDVLRFQRLKEKARNPGTIKRFKGLEQRARDELSELEKQAKPSFWIDQDSVAKMSSKVAGTYQQHKAANIKVSTSTKSSQGNTLLLQAADLGLGYDYPLFQPVSFELREGDRLELKGRNGVGKSTLARAIIDTWQGSKLSSQIYGGYIDHDKTLRIGVYEQELSEYHLHKTLAQAIEDVYREKGLPVSDQLVASKMGQYLFNPGVEGQMPLSRLSGGQKARFQLISMLAGDPNVLILDEPTNHLDLPSIEELENALQAYHGAVIYISHDSYFSAKMAGKIVEVAPSTH